jgi:predicted Rossmann fold flavoprotein
VLQVSSFWQPGTPLRLALADGDLAERLRQAKTTSRRQLGNELALHLPERLAQTWLQLQELPAQRPMPEVRDKDIARLVDSLTRWQVQPTGTEGWRKAEVMAGGVDTRELDSQTMASRRLPGLHFIGEVVDVTGWLGGYNFQWAWASAAACARAL